MATSAQRDRQSGGGRIEPPRRLSLGVTRSWLRCQADRRRLAPLCERVHLRRGSVIADIGAQIRYAYFPSAG